MNGADLLERDAKQQGYRILDNAEKNNLRGVEVLLQGHTSEKIYASTIVPMLRR
jgi:hypothetical protein